MLATTILQLVPATNAMFDSMPFLRMSDIYTFVSNCEALFWAVEVLYLAGFIVTARKHAHFTATSIQTILCVLNGT